MTCYDDRHCDTQLDPTARQNLAHVQAPISIRTLADAYSKNEARMAATRGIPWGTRAAHNTEVRQTRKKGQGEPEH